MKIKEYKNLFRYIFITLSIFFAFSASFVYFLGFTINLKSFLYFLSIVLTVIILNTGLYFLISYCSKSIIIFDNEYIIIKGKKGEKTRIKQSRIIYKKYIKAIDFHDTFSYNFCSFVKITFKNQKDETEDVILCISKKDYLALIKNNLL